VADLPIAFAAKESYGVGVGRRVRRRHRARAPSVVLEDESDRRDARFPRKAWPDPRTSRALHPKFAGLSELSRGTAFRDPQSRICRSSARRIRRRAGRCRCGPRWWRIAGRGPSPDRRPAIALARALRPTGFVTPSVRKRPSDTARRPTTRWPLLRGSGSRARQVIATSSRCRLRPWRRGHLSIGGLLTIGVSGDCVEASISDEPFDRRHGRSYPGPVWVDVCCDAPRVV
jgi:hypothetical protein